MSHRPPIAPERRNRRALILPGGGMRVAYQAGAVQRLHEAGLRFSYADGTSGGLMNLAALMSGVAPEDLALRWRRLRPSGFISPLSPGGYLGFPDLPAFGDFDGIAGYVYPHLGIDAARINAAEGVSARFNICDFAAKAVVSVPHGQVTVEKLLAGMSLPIFTPAVEAEGTTWTDAVWIKDSNLLQAVRDGANELWVIWCIGNTPAWKTGMLNQYVHMIEMAAVGALNAEMAEIARLNAAIERGETPFGHRKPIRVHLIRPALPIPLDPDYVAGRISGHALVDQGYMDASAYLKGKDAGSPLDGSATRTPAPPPGVTFRETMRGRIAFGTRDPQAGWRDVNAVPLALNATIAIRDIAGFIADPAHRAGMAAHVYSPRLGFVRPATGANFQLFAPTDDAAISHMTYEVGLLLDGQPHWLSGQKHIRKGPPWRMWRETTSLHVRLHRGTDARGEVVAAGMLRLGILDFLGLLATLSARDAQGRGRIRAVSRFMGFFTGTLGRTYLHLRRQG